MKKYTLVGKSILVLLTTVILTHQVYAETLWEKYLAMPDKVNASRVTRIEYSPGGIPDGYLYSESDMQILQNQVLAADSEAFHLAYKLLVFYQTGALAEELIMIMARTIRTNPLFFLTSVKRIKPERHYLESILLTPGLEYVDRYEAKRYELRMRFKAIESIRHEDIVKYQHLCLGILKQRI